MTEHTLKATVFEPRSSTPEVELVTVEVDERAVSMLLDEGREVVFVRDELVAAINSHDEERRVA